MKFFAVLLAVLLLNLAIDPVDAGCGKLCLVCAGNICLFPPGIPNVGLHQNAGYDLDNQLNDFPLGGFPQGRQNAIFGCSSSCKLCVAGLCIIP